MTPYYDHDGITIYHGDCMDVLRDVRVQAIVTDPPFGTGWVRGYGAMGEFMCDRTRPSWDVFSLAWIDAARPVEWIAFAPNSRTADMARIASSRVYWRKTNPRPNGPPLEPVFMWPMRVPNGIEWVGYNGDTTHHPCEKPVELMTWLLGFVSCDSVVDPFMGSGSTLVAAKRAGVRAIGIEIDERYCEIAAKRLAQGVLPLCVSDHADTAYRLR